MFSTSRSKLAHATVVAGTISLLLSSSALAGFHVGGGFRGGGLHGGSFVRAPAMARVTAAIHPSFGRGNMLRATSGPAPDRFGGARAVYRRPGQNGSAALGTVQTGAATGNAQIGAVASLFQAYNGPNNIGPVQFGAGTSGNGQIGARGGLLHYRGPGAATHAYMRWRGPVDGRLFLNPQPLPPSP